MWELHDEVLHRLGQSGPRSMLPVVQRRPLFRDARFSEAVAVQNSISSF